MTHHKQSIKHPAPTKTITIQAKVPLNFDEDDRKQIEEVVGIEIRRLAHRHSHREMTTEILFSDDALTKAIKEAGYFDVNYRMKYEINRDCPPVVRAFTYNKRKRDLFPMFPETDGYHGRQWYSGDDGRTPVLMLGSIFTMWYADHNDHGRYNQAPKLWFRWRRRFKYTCLDQDQYHDDVYAFQHRLAEKRYGRVWWGYKSLLELDRDPNTRTRSSVEAFAPDNKYKQRPKPFNDIWINGQFFKDIPLKKYLLLVELYKQVQLIDGLNQPSMEEV